VRFKAEHPARVRGQGAIRSVFETNPVCQDCKLIGNKLLIYFL
jgi:hypothetical protein